MRTDFKTKKPMKLDNNTPEILTESQLVYYYEFKDKFKDKFNDKNIDSQVLINLSINSDLRDKLQQEINANGIMYEIDGRNGLQKKMNPAVAQLSKTLNDLRVLLGEFGMTPTTRKKIHIENNDQEEIKFMGLAKVAH